MAAGHIHLKGNTALSSHTGWDGLTAFAKASASLAKARARFTASDGGRRVPY